MPEILIHDRQGTVSVRESPSLTLLEKFWVELEMEDGTIITTCQAGLAFDSGKWTCRLMNARLKLDLDVRNIGNPRGLVLNVRVCNEGDSDVRVKRVALIKQRVPRSGSVLGNPAEWRVFKMGYASGGLHGEEDTTDSGFLAMTEGDKRIRSWGVCVIKPAGIEGGLVMGFVTSARQMTWIDVEKEDGEVSLSAVCDTEGRPIAPGSALITESLYVGFHENPGAGIRSYAELCGREMEVKLKPPPSGWSAGESPEALEMNEEKFLELAQFLGAVRRRLPLEVVEVSGGFAAAHGDWLAPGEGFPGGLERLAHGIKERGVVPGIRLAPFAVSPSSRLAAEHPEWLLKDGPGNPISWEPRGREDESFHLLDAGHGEAKAWLAGLFGVLRSYGYRYFMLDWLFLGAVKGTRAGGGSRVEIYREALKAIRRGAGEAYLCGGMAPFLPSVGLLDGVHVGGGEALDGSAKAEGGIHNRFYSHRSLWNNYPGPVSIKQAESGDAARSAAVRAVMSGGALFSGDWLPSLPSERIEVLSEALCAGTGSAAMPLDFLERPLPRVLAARLGRGRWRLGVFNVDGYARSLSADLRGLGLGAGRVFLESGSGRRLLGRAGKVLVTPPIPAHGVITILIEGAGS